MRPAIKLQLSSKPPGLKLLLEIQSSVFRSQTLYWSLLKYSLTNCLINFFKESLNEMTWLIKLFFDLYLIRYHLQNQHQFKRALNKFVTLKSFIYWITLNNMFCFNGVCVCVCCKLLEGKIQNIYKTSKTVV